MKDLISVIIPIYNVELRYHNALANCLSSIQNQTYNNIEVIMVNDGSTDNSGTICDRFVIEDKRFKVHHISNIGMCAARNYGINHSQGEFIFLCDADDLVHPQCLEVLLRLLVEHPDCDIARGDVQLVEKPFVHIDKPNYIVYNNDYMIKSILGGRMISTVWNQLIRRNIIESVKFRITTFEDMDFDLRAYFEAKKIVYLNHITYNWIQRDLSDCHTNKIKRYYGKLESLEYLYYNDIKDKHPKYISYLLWYIYSFYMNDIAANFHKMTNEYKQKVYKKFILIYKETKDDYFKSDAPTKNKILLPLLVRCPKIKKPISIIYNFFKAK